MIQVEFDATITLNDHHLTTSGLSAPEAVTAVRQAVERMDGAGWIDVAAWSYPPATPGWVILYPPGRAAAPPDRPEWQELRRQVEAIATAALVGAGAPF
jgi:hypothetical protein